MHRWLAVPSVLLLPGPVAAQTQAAVQPAAAEAPPSQGYSYSAAGRRDPFLPLIERGSTSRSQMVVRPDGLPGVAVGEVALKGIVVSRGTFFAMLQAPDDRTYIVRGGDQLFDATVKAVTADAVVFLQPVTDPLSPIKQREIRRPLRSIEEGN